MPATLRTLALACLACAAALRPARTAELAALSLPSGVLADNATETAVLCSISDGYPNNTYSIKGTFSPGELPYFGVTYNPATTLWVPQNGSWAAAQTRVVTDSRGSWVGWLYVRLETTAPPGPITFRVSAVPLDPVSLPGPTVGPWMPMAALDPAASAGWLAGHVFLDPDCRTPAESVIVQAEDVFGRVLGAYASQNAFTLDDENPSDRGFVRLGVPIGTVATVIGRTRKAGPLGPPGARIPLYVKSRGPWKVSAGQTVSLDAVNAWGDADADGALTLNDAVLALRLGAGLDSPEAGHAAADVWPDLPDGAVTVHDACLLIRSLAAA